MKTILDELVANYVKPSSRSTFLQDWMKDRRSEVDEINGLVVAGLEAHGLSAPVNQAVLEFAHDIEKKVRTRGIHNYEPLLKRIAELDAETNRAAAPARP
jgi:2-dehydropantoate 2-reductase